MLRRGELASARRIGLVLIVALLPGLAPAAAQSVSASAGEGLATPAGEPAGVTPEQIANVKERVAIAAALVDGLAPEARTLGLAEGWRQATLESLLSRPLAELRAMRSIRSVGALTTVIASGSGGTVTPSDFGSVTEDLIYKPITPCRYVDTRNVGGRIDGLRGYDLQRAGNYYGGSAACDPLTLFGVGENAFGAIAMNMTIVDPTAAPGFGAIKPTSASPVSSLINWYDVGPSVQAANQGILTMDHGGAEPEFYVQTSAPVHVIIDVFGAFIAPNATALDCVVLAQTTMLAAGASGTVTSPSCTTGYTLTGGSCTATYGTHQVSSSPYIVNNWLCSFDNGTGAQTQIVSRAICCRVPGR